MIKLQHKKKIELPFLFCVSVGVLTLLLTGVCLGAQTVRFQFNPPDGIAFIETHRQTKRITIIGVKEEMPPAHTNQAKIKYQITKTEGGYSVITSPIAPDEKVSDDVATLMANLMQNMAITYDLDHNGQLVRVRGFREAFDKIAKSLPPELVGLIKSMLPQSMEQQVAQQWKMRSMLGLHVGKNMELNKNYYLSGQLPTPAGPGLQLTGTIKTTRTQKCKSGNCVVVSYKYESGDQMVAQGMNSMIRQAMFGFLQMMPPKEAQELSGKLPTMEVKDSRLTEKGARTLDPATGLIYGEETKRNISATVVFQGEEQRQFQHTETNYYRYDYE
jgi:hypothetical protein